MYTNFLIFNILFFILINVGELSDGVKKILLNWLQVSSMAAAFPLKWPAAMQGLFVFQSVLSSERSIK